MMKQVIDIDSKKDPHLQDLYELASKAINQIIDNKAISISPLSHDGVMKKIEQGKLIFKEMENDMKISQSKFFHYYTPDMKEVIIQRTGSKLAVFSD